MNLSDMVRKMQKLGYEADDAEARVCQDIVLTLLLMMRVRHFL